MAMICQIAQSLPEGASGLPWAIASMALAAAAVVVRAVEAVLVGADDRDREADVAAVEVVAGVRDARVVRGVAVRVGGRLGIGLIDGRRLDDRDQGQVDSALARGPDAGSASRAVSAAASSSAAWMLGRS